MWEEKAKTLTEERTKQRAALETELRSLRAAQDELAAKFDESMVALLMVCIPFNVSSWMLWSLLAGLSMQSLPLLVVADLLRCHVHAYTCYHIDGM